MNRRAIMATVSEERERMRRTGMPFAVALFDIDFFKRVNDERGHLIGDEVLRRFCAAAGEAIRTTDRLGRFGGEEFLVLMPVTDTTEAAHAAAERVRDAVARVDWNGVDAGLEVTVSAGVAVATLEDTLEALLGRADMALYAAKHEAATGFVRPTAAAGSRPGSVQGAEPVAAQHAAAMQQPPQGNVALGRNTSAPQSISAQPACTRKAAGAPTQPASQKVSTRSQTCFSSGCSRRCRWCHTFKS
jgi:diguanylate cyclase (GGDEF)-like protein